MRIPIAILFWLFSHAAAWTPPSLPKPLRQACASATLCATLLAPIQANALSIDFNLPFVLEQVKSPEKRQQTLDRLVFLSDSIATQFGQAVTIQLTKDEIPTLVRNAAQGQVDLTVNGQAVHVGVTETRPGSLTVRIDSSLLPPLPLLKPSDSAKLAAVSTPALEWSQLVWQALNQPKAEQPPFWTTPLFNGQMQIADYAVTPRDVVGVGGIALGTAYGGAYAYYVSENERDEQKALAKKEALAAKKKAKGDDAKVDDDPKMREKEKENASADTKEGEVKDTKAEVTASEAEAKETGTKAAKEDTPEQVDTQDEPKTSKEESVREEPARKGFRSRLRERFSSKK